MARPPHRLHRGCFCSWVGLVHFILGPRQTSQATQAPFRRSWLPPSQAQLAQAWIEPSPGFQPPQRPGTAHSINPFSCPQHPQTTGPFFSRYHLASVNRPRECLVAIGHRPSTISHRRPSAGRPERLPAGVGLSPTMNLLLSPQPPLFPHQQQDLSRRSPPRSRKYGAGVRRACCCVCCTTRPRLPRPSARSADLQQPSLTHLFCRIPIQYGVQEAQS